MTEYRVLQDFKGSPDGMQVITYRTGQTVALPESLATVALAEQWISPVTAEPAAVKPRRK